MLPLQVPPLRCPLSTQTEPAFHPSSRLRMHLAMERRILDLCEEASAKRSAERLLSLSRGGNLRQFGACIVCLIGRMKHIRTYNRNVTAAAGAQLPCVPSALQTVGVQPTDLPIASRVPPWGFSIRKHARQPTPVVIYRSGLPRITCAPFHRANRHTESLSPPNRPSCCFWLPRIAYFLASRRPADQDSIPTLRASIATVEASPGWLTYVP